MRCPYCKSSDHSVLESRVTEDASSIRRRRECSECNKRFTTYERVEGLDLKVVKKDGVIEDFDREKIRRGLIKATWKRPVKMEDIEDIVQEIEGKLRLRKDMRVKSIEIGKMVIHRLKKLDPLGYLLFASVYRDFEDISDFEEEITKLKSTSKEENE